MEGKPLPSIDEIWDYSNPTETESKFRALLPKAEQLNPAFALEISTQIARTLGLQRKFEEALQVLNSIKDKLSENLSLPTIRYHLEKEEFTIRIKSPLKPFQNSSKHLI